MKNTLIILLVIFSLNCAKAQTAYYDAIKLKAIFSAAAMNDASFKQASDILSNYTSASKISKNALFIQKQFIDADNQFIPSAYTKYTPADPSIKANFDVLLKTLKSTNKNLMLSSGTGIISTIGNLDVTAFADGIAQFLVDRAKTELNEAFFDRLKSFLDKYPEVKTIFPNTYVLLDNFDSYQYSNLLNTLKEAFDKDLKLLPADMIKLKDIDESECTGDAGCIDRLKKIKTFFATNDGILMLSALKIGDGIIQSHKLPDIINSVIQPDFLLAYKINGDTALTADLKHTLEVANFFNLSIESNEPGKNYIGTDDFAKLTGDTDLLRIYLGLVYQQIASASSDFVLKINNINITGPNGVITPGNINEILLYLANIYKQAAYLQQTYDTLSKDKLNPKIDFSQDYTALFATAQNLFQSSFTLNTLNPNLANTSITNKITSLRNYINKALQIANDISVRNYNAVVIGSLSLLSDAINAAKLSKDEDIKLFSKSLLKYGSFAANIVAAKNGDDAEKAIEAVALPAGSYTMKQKALCNISVNGYLGYARDYNGGKLYAQGLYAPVGVSASVGLGPNLGGALTLFVSAIDVGALVSYKLHNNTATGANTDTLKQQVRLESIISPSAQLFFEIPKLPVAIGAGWRMTPKLFYSNNSTLTPVPSRSVFNVSVLIDIPILTLHSSPYKKMAKSN